MVGEGVSYMSAQGSGAFDLRRPATIVGAWIALGIVALMAFNAYGDYRVALKNQDTGTRSEEQTASAEASGTGGSGEGTKTAAVSGTVVVLAEGLNMREESNTGGKVIKKLKRGSSLELVEKALGWYKVRDAEGDVGWVAAGGQYSKLSE